MIRHSTTDSLILYLFSTSHTVLGFIQYFHDNSLNLSWLVLDSISGMSCESQLAVKVQGSRSVSQVNTAQESAFTLSQLNEPQHRGKIIMMYAIIIPSTTDKPLSWNVLKEFSL
jgi:hypothetical protein